MKRVLISVYDKRGILSFARELSKLGIEIIATGGTYKTLKDGGIRFVKHVSDVTEFPEILEGRVKTEHPKLIGGILALRDEKEHVKDLARFGIEPGLLITCLGSSVETAASSHKYCPPNTFWMLSILNPVAPNTKVKESALKYEQCS